MGPRPHKPSPIQEVVRGWSMTPSYWYEEWRKERAKVAALEAEQRLMQAEAQLLREEQGADEAVKHIMELETDVERLRCCGNCGEIGDCLDSDSDGRQHCEPSRWASREEAGDE